MSRPAAVTVVTALLLSLGPDPAHAATAALVVPCQPATEECWPAAFAFTPKGRFLFYVERFTGEIHRVNLRTGADGLWGDVGDPAGGGERGALGIAVDPRWDREARSRHARRQRRRVRWVYVFFTNQSAVENRVVRTRKLLHGGFATQQLLTIGIAVGANHNGGPIHFGTDGKLYVATGDQAEPDRAQSFADPAGKVLRINKDGGRPPDNPIPGSLAYSFGHRNSFGLAIDPVTGDVWQTENGPNCNDEVNRIVSGGNFAWGPAGITCDATRDVGDTNQSGPTPWQLPAWTYSTVIVPTGAAFCRDCRLGPDVEGDLLLGAYSDGVIRDLNLSPSRDTVLGETALYDHHSGVLAVERRPNGQVFFSDEKGIYRLGP